MKTKMKRYISNINSNINVGILNIFSTYNNSINGIVKAIKYRHAIQLKDFVNVINPKARLLLVTPIVILFNLMLTNILVSVEPILMIMANTPINKNPNGMAKSLAIIFRGISAFFISKSNIIVKANICNRVLLKAKQISMFKKPKTNLSTGWYCLNLFEWAKSSI
jgi:hypothetical protein